MQAALISASLLIVLAMLGSIVWLSMARPLTQSEAVPPLETADETV
jgi:hypothetical protein